MPQLYPNPLSSNIGITVNTEDGVYGGGAVALAGQVTLSGSAVRQAYTCTPTANGSVGTFQILGPPPSGYADVFVGGVLQVPVTAYTIVGNQIFFVTAPSSGNTPVVVFGTPSDLREQATLTPVSSTVFAFDADQPNATYVDIYVNGVQQQAGGTYTLNYVSGSWTVVFGSAPASTPVAVFQADNFSDRNQYALAPVTDGTTTSFRIVGAVPTSSYVDVFVAGLFQSPAVYSLNLVAGEWFVVFTTAPSSGSTAWVTF
jgi:hypothetical protein